MRKACKLLLWNVGTLISQGSRVVVVVGPPRSGTTWLMEALAKSLKARVAFEPLSINVPTTGKTYGANFGLGLRPVWRNGSMEPHLELLWAALLGKRILRGAQLNCFSYPRDISALRIASRIAINRATVIKCIRASRMVEWITLAGQPVKVILLERDPADTVLSQLRYELAQSASVTEAEARIEARHPVTSGLSTTDSDALLSTSGPLTAEVRLAITLAIDTHYSKRAASNPNCLKVSYEELIRHTASQATRINCFLNESVQLSRYDFEFLSGTVVDAADCYASYCAHRKVSNGEMRRRIYCGLRKLPIAPFGIECGSSMTRVEQHLATVSASKGCRPGAVTLAVAIVTRNRLPMLQRCLKSIQSHEPNAAVHVVDDGSTDGTRQWLLSRNGLAASHFEGRIGPARGRNVAAARLTADLLLFLDDDTWLSGSVLSKAVSVIAENPKCACVGFPIFDVYKNGILYAGRRGEAKCFAAGAVMFQRSIFVSLGGFDPSLSWSEEFDLAIRLKDAGYRIFNVDGPIVYHEGESFQTISEAKKLGYAVDARLRTFAKHFRWRCAVTFSARFLASAFTTSLKRRQLSGLLMGFCLAAYRLPACLRRRALVKKETEEFFFTPNYHEDESSVPLRAKIGAALAKLIGIRSAQI